MRQAPIKLLGERESETRVRYILGCVQLHFTPSINPVLLHLLLLYTRYNLSPIDNEGPVKAATRVERRGGEVIGSIPAFDSLPAPASSSPESRLQISLLGISLVLLMSSAKMC